MNLNPRNYMISQNTLADLKGPKRKSALWMINFIFERVIVHGLRVKARCRELTSTDFFTNVDGLF